MKTVTIEDILPCHPCGWDNDDDGRNYTRARLERLFAGRERVSARDVVAADIPRYDVIWLLTQPIFMTGVRAGLFACECAERALPFYERQYPDDPRPRRAIEICRRYVDGLASIEELREAEAAARAAAEYAAVAAHATRAAEAAAVAAAWAAVWAATGDAAHETAGAAAWAFVRVAGDAWGAEYEWQIQRALELIEAEVGPGGSD